MQESTTAGVVEDDFDDFDPHALAMGDEDDRARLKEHYRAEWVGKPVAGVPDSKIQTDEDFDEMWPKIQDHLARMGRAAEAKSNVADVTAPAGTYHLGDPCYAVPDDEWDSLISESDEGFPFGAPVGHLSDGTQIIAFSTAYGDGFFPDNHDNLYPVDAGLIGLVPVTPATEAALAETYETAMAHGVDHQFMARVSFDEPVECTRTGRGLLTFGSYQIDTA
jgi:hypothetical protein